MSKRCVRNLEAASLRDPDGVLGQKIQELHSTITEFTFCVAVVHELSEVAPSVALV